MSIQRFATIAWSCIACTLGAAVPVQASAPMREYLELPRTDYAVAGVGGIGASDNEGGGAGTLKLAGVSGTVTLALLYWNGIDIEMPPKFTGGDADYDQPQIRFDGEDITGTRVAGFNGNDCWPQTPTPPSAALYRADVTALVQARGNGDYEFSKLADKPGHSANGMSLIVYFNDGNAANDLHVNHYEGMQDSQGEMTFDFPLDYNGGVVSAIIHVSDGQAFFPDGDLIWHARPDIVGSTEHTVRYRGTLHDGLPMFAGTSVPLMPFGRPDNGPGLWDIRQMPLTPIFGPPGRYKNHITTVPGPDCVTLQIAQIVQPADPQAPALTPASADFGDVVIGMQSAPQRFTLTNLMPGPITITTVETNPVFPIVAQTCAGQVVPTGATCTVDVAFKPSTVALPLSKEIKINFHDIALPLYSNHWFFAELHGAGIPDAPFSRVETKPSQCKFKPGQLGVASAPVSLRLASTGSLPVTITASRMYSGAVPPQFNIVSEDCVGRTLQPGSSCTTNLSASRSRLGFTDQLVLNYEADDSNPGGVAVVVNGIAFPATGDLMFADGFDPGQCVD